MFPVLAAQVSATSGVFGNYRFWEGICKPGCFWVAYSFMSMSEKCPDNLMANLVQSLGFVDIFRVFQGDGVERMKWT